MKSNNTNMMRCFTRLSGGRGSRARSFLCRVSGLSPKNGVSSSDMRKKHIVKPLLLSIERSCLLDVFLSFTSQSNREETPGPNPYRGLGLTNDLACGVMSVSAVRISVFLSSQPTKDHYRLGNCVLAIYTFSNLQTLKVKP